MRELSQETLLHVAGGCEEGSIQDAGGLNQACQALFILTITEGDSNVPPFLGMLLMLHHCSSSDIQQLLADFQTRDEDVNPA